MRSRFLAACGLIFATLLAACGGDAGAGSGLSVITDSAGVSLATGPAGDVPLPWTLTEIRRVGGEDEGPASFSSVNVWTVASDGAGRFAVLDTENSQIHVFDSAGAHVRSVGARGAGPGEMQFPSSLAMQGDGSVSVFDFAKRAMLRWDAAGQVLPEIRWPDGEGMPTGRSTARGDTVAFQLRAGDTTRVVKTIRLVTPRDTVDVDSVLSARERMIMFSCVGLSIAPLFEGDLEWALGDAMIATTRQTDYVIDIRESGKLVRSVRRSIAGQPATAADADRLYPDGMEVGFGNGRKCVTPAKEVAEKAGIAKTIPTVKSIRFGPQGTLWVERFTFKGETPAVDVFDASGRYLGTIAGRSLPLGFLGNDIVMFPIEDEATGVRVIGLFRIGRR